MRTQALLLLCGATASMSGVAYLGASLSGRLDMWLMILFIASSVLTLLFMLVLIVSAARRSIESSIEDQEIDVPSPDTSSERG